MTLGVDERAQRAVEADSARVLRAAAPRAKKSVALWSAAALGLAGLFLAGHLPRQARVAALHADAEASAAAPLRPALAHPKQSPDKEQIELPVTLRGAEETAIYARASGYVRRWHVDMGETVRAGALLAELDTPELDLELDRARADVTRAEAAVTKARAALTFAESSLERLGPLSGRGLVSKQELAQSEAQRGVDAAQVEVAEAERSAARATVARLAQLEGFSRIVAPFAGVITARNVERGNLVVAGASTALFTLSAIDKVTAHAAVPQSLALELGGDAEATLVVSELKRRFPARLAHRAQRFDPATRTMDVELAIDNIDHALLPGMYARVAIALKRAQPSLRIPASALITDAAGTQVARLVADARVELVQVRVARDHGGEIELEDGLSLADEILVNPPPGLRSGTRVERP